MPRLILMQDPLHGGRTYHELTLGANLGDELRRLFPQGFSGPWHLYRSEAIAENELDWQKHPVTTVDEGLYLLIVRPAGGFELVPFLWNLAVSLAISGLLYLLTPKPKPHIQQPHEEAESPNNKISGQSNALRAGARVPDVLGKMRVWPDLLTNAIEEWPNPRSENTQPGTGDGRTQRIDQYFVVGMGDYVHEDDRLGDTSLDFVSNIAREPFPPDTPIPVLPCVRISSTVNNIALSSTDSSLPPVANLSFDDGPPSTMTSPTTALPLAVDNPFTVGAGSFNAGMHFLLAVGGAQPPWVYTINGRVVDESNTGASLTQWAKNVAQGYSGVDVNDDAMTFRTYFTNAYQRGDAVLIVYNGQNWYGTIRDVTVISQDQSGQLVKCNFLDMYGSSMHLGTASNAGMFLTNWRPPPPSLLSEGAELTASDPTMTGWQAAPLRDPDELWIDIAFPQGLVHYKDSFRTPYRVRVRADFQRGTTGPIVSLPFVYEASSGVPLRYTERVLVSQLGIGLTGEPIQVRLQRETQIENDDATNQYVADTRWAEFKAVKNFINIKFKDVYILRLRIANSRSAGSVGEYSFNTVVTRKLPQWSAGSGWSAPVPTERWADAMVYRMKSPDGAFKTDAEIDLAGIYALQSQLDAIDPGADQGKISLTLDQMNDIDTELQLIASIVRAQVYRVGPKLFVTRDQGGKPPLALITGRSKSPDGEQVQFAMKNDSENDAVVVSWFDRANGWKVREYQYAGGENVVPLNELRVSPTFANWPQAYRRALYEWNRIKYRRDTLNVQATEEARLLHIGDVINVTDDVANLAIWAGEVIAVSGLSLELDVPVDLSAGGYSIMLRALDGRTTNVIAVSAGAAPHLVTLATSPAFAIKGRDESMGTVYALYNSAKAIVRPWLVTSLEPGAPYTRILAQNWRTEVFAGDSGSIPAPLALGAETAMEG